MQMHRAFWATRSRHFGQKGPCLQSAGAACRGGSRAEGFTKDCIIRVLKYQRITQVASEIAVIASGASLNRPKHRRTWAWLEDGSADQLGIGSLA